MAKVLLVDDEEVLRTSLGYALKKEGFQVATAADGGEALEEARTFAPDVILLDVMLPGIDGFEVCRRLRDASADMPVIFLTAKDQSGDRVHGLETGADDYVIKPFNTRELIARVHAVLRRRQQAQRILEADRDLVARLEELVSATTARASKVGAEHGEEGVLRVGPIEVDVDRDVARLWGETLALAPTELRVLKVLMLHARRVVTRTELLETVFGQSAPDGLALLDAHIRVLREKIEVDPTRPRLLVTVPGIGFMLEPTG
jgi:two-component system response regulator RegX3